MPGSTAYLGDVNKYNPSTGTGSSGANTIYLTKWNSGHLPIKGVVAGGIDLQSFTGKIKMVVYDDSAGSPNNLLATSTEVVNPATGYQAFAFSSFDLAADSPYWLGYITDTAFNVVVGTVGSGFGSGESWGPRLGYNQSYVSGPPASLSGATPSFGSSKFSNLCHEYLQGAYATKIFGDAEWTPAFDGANLCGTDTTSLTSFIAQDSLTNVIAGHLKASVGSGTAKCKLLVYNDDGSNHPGTLRAASNELVGPSAGLNDFTFATPFSIVGGTRYWIGLIVGTAAFQQWEAPPGTYTNRGWAQSTPYVSGPVSPLYSGGGTTYTSSTLIQTIYLDNGVASTAVMPISQALG